MYINLPCEWFGMDFARYVRYVRRERLIVYLKVETSCHCMFSSLYVFISETEEERAY